jgi:nicotinamide mononucleotide adenylyltransferase
MDWTESMTHIWNNQERTTLLMGRFQPWHDGHQALFEEALLRTPQVLIAVRDTEGVDEKNPFNFEFVKTRIDVALVSHVGRYQVWLLPNITNQIYGRDVGYVIERVHLDAHIESISATKIRQHMSDQAGNNSQ